MYQGKHVAYSRNPHRRERRLRWGREFVLLCSVVVLLVGVIGGTVAYLVTNTDPVVNTFTPASNDPTIPENFDGSTKSDVKVKVNGDAELSSYVRAKLVFSWVTDDGTSVAPVSASAADCSVLTINTDVWQLVGDYYYYKGTVAGGTETPNLIETCTPTKNSITVNGETYHFCVDVFAQTIQATPANAVQESWGMTYSNGSWSVYSAG